MLKKNMEFTNALMYLIIFNSDFLLIYCQDTTSDTGNSDTCNPPCQYCCKNQKCLNQGSCDTANLQTYMIIAGSVVGTGVFLCLLKVLYTKLRKKCLKNKKLEAQNSIVKSSAKIKNKCIKNFNQTFQKQRTYIKKVEYVNGTENNPMQPNKLQEHNILTVLTNQPLNPMTEIDHLLYNENKKVDYTACTMNKEEKNECGGGIDIISTSPKYKSGNTLSINESNNILSGKKDLHNTNRNNKTQSKPRKRKPPKIDTFLGSASASLDGIIWAKININYGFCNNMDKIVNIE